VNVTEKSVNKRQNEADLNSHRYVCNKTFVEKKQLSSILYPSNRFI